MKVLKIKIGLAVGNTEKKKINGGKTTEDVWGCVRDYQPRTHLCEAFVSRLTTKPILHTLVKKILRVTLTSK